MLFCWRVFQQFIIIYSFQNYFIWPVLLQCSHYWESENWLNLIYSYVDSLIFNKDIYRHSFLLPFSSLCTGLRTHSKPHWYRSNVILVFSYPDQDTYNDTYNIFFFKHFNTLLRYPHPSPYNLSKWDYLMLLLFIIFLILFSNQL